MAENVHETPEDAIDEFSNWPAEDPETANSVELDEMDAMLRQVDLEWAASW